MYGLLGVSWSVLLVCKAPCARATPACVTTRPRGARLTPHVLARRPCAPPGSEAARAHWSDHGRLDARATWSNHSRPRHTDTRLRRGCFCVFVCVFVLTPALRVCTQVQPMFSFCFKGEDHAPKQHDVVTGWVHKRGAQPSPRDRLARPRPRPNTLLPTRGKVPAAACSSLTG